MNPERKEKLGIALIIIVTIVALTMVLIQSPMAQDVRYHLLVDARTLWRIPNFWNVVSNLPYFIVGILGFYKVTRSTSMPILPDIRLAYILLFSGVSLVAFGSGYYHLAPDNSTLVWDRLPMTIAFMSFFAILLSEFISVKVGKALLIPLVVAGFVSVLYWHLSEGWGEGDLRFYVLVQFTPVLLLPVILLCFRPRYTGLYGYWGLLVAYIVAKLCEHFDAEIYSLLGYISGHSIKHMVSALGVYMLLVSYEKRVENY